MAWRSCGPRGRTVSTVTFWDTITQPFCQPWQLLLRRRCTKPEAANAGLEAHWKMTLGMPAAYRAGTTLEADVLYIPVTIQLPFSGSVMKSHPGALTLQFLLFKVKLSLLNHLHYRFTTTLGRKFGGSVAVLP